MSNIEKVKAFIQKWEAIDFDGIVASFADEFVYHNMPMEPITSKEGVRAFLDSFMTDVSVVDWELKFITEDENGVVLTEREDRFVYSDKKIVLPVMGVFEFSGDKISYWRDYFDASGL